jgi:cyclopropane fatty-acyl-phospholipid synthase-like methyltransferase
MAHRVCPWWLGYLLISPLRSWWQDPAKILNGYVSPGMTVLEPGPGMGFFTLDLLRKVGEGGKVVALDVQPKMLSRLKRRAAKAGVSSRLDARLASADSMGMADLTGKVDFTLAFAVVHEFPDAADFFRQVDAASKPGAAILLAEPKGHLSSEEFEKELYAASQSGFRVQSRPRILRSLTALLVKS